MLCSKSFVVFFLTLFFSLILCSSAYAQSEPESGPPKAETSVYVHKSLNFVFPGTVGNFERAKPMEYGTSGKEVSVGYGINDPGKRGVVIVYLYPAFEGASLDSMQGVILFPALLYNKHFKELKSTISKKFSATETSDEEVSLNVGGKTRKGRKASFEWNDNKGRKVLSYLYLFTYKNWFVKYRVTYHEAQKALIQPDVDQFMSQLAWPEK